MSATRCREGSIWVARFLRAPSLSHSLLAQRSSRPIWSLQRRGSHPPSKLAASHRKILCCCCSPVSAGHHVPRRPRFKQGPCHTRRVHSSKACMPPALPHLDVMKRFLPATSPAAVLSAALRTVPSAGACAPGPGSGVSVGRPQWAVGPSAGAASCSKEEGGSSRLQSAVVRSFRHHRTCGHGGLGSCASGAGRAEGGAATQPNFWWEQGGGAPGHQAACRAGAWLKSSVLQLSTMKSSPATERPQDQSGARFMVCC